MSKGQSAMEFLLTYGWAIMIVFVLIISLSYFDVFNVSKLLPDTCDFPAGFECKDAAINSQTQVITLILKNNLGSDISINDAYFTDSEFGCSSISSIDVNSNPLPISIVHNSEFTLNIHCVDGLVKDKRFRSIISINHTYIQSLSKHVVAGRLRQTII